MYREETKLIFCTYCEDQGKMVVLLAVGTTSVWMLQMRMSCQSNRFGWSQSLEMSQAKMMMMNLTLMKMTYICGGIQYWDIKCDIISKK